MPYLMCMRQDLCINIYLKNGEDECIVSVSNVFRHQGDESHSSEDERSGGLRLPKPHPLSFR